MSTAVQLAAPSLPTEVIPGLPYGEALEVYLNRLSAPGTRRQYGAAVREMFTWLGMEMVDQVTPGDLARYRAHLVEKAQGRQLSGASVAQKLAAVKGFFTFCRLVGGTGMSRELVSFALAGYRATVIKPYQVLSEAEQGDVLDYLDSQRAHCVGQAERDYALVLLILATGLRAAEVCALQVGDILRDEDGDWTLRVRQGKGRKDRLVPLAAGVQQELRSWLAFSGREMGRKEDQGSYIFYGRDGLSRPLTTRRLQDVVREAVRGAGIREKAITPHSLRHTAAIGWLRDGASLPVVQRLLGHARVDTTQRYLDHLEWGELKRWAREL